MGFSDTVSVGVVSSPAVEGTEEDFARLLQPMAPEEPAEDGALNDSLSRYLQPLDTLDTLEKGLLHLAVTKLNSFFKKKISEQCGLAKNSKQTTKIKLKLLL